MIIAKDRSLVGHVISQRQMEQIPEDKLDLMFEASNIALNWVYWADDATLFNAPTWRPYHASSRMPGGMSGRSPK
jgi:hypothetical protein